MSQEAPTPDNASPFHITQIDPRSLSEAEHVELLAFSNVLRAEAEPDDPPRTLEAQKANWRNIPSMVAVHHWVVRDGTQPGNPVVASGDLHYMLQEHNQHIADFGIRVLPTRRREGIARLLLARIAETAREQNRTLLMTGSTDRVPSGAAFLEHLGAEPGLASHTNQLILADLDRDFLRAYKEEGERRGGGEFELIRCDSPIPEDMLVPAAELANIIMNDVPIGDLDMAPHQMTPEQIREMDRTQVAAGMKNLTLVARERATGKLVGVTMMTWNKHMPYKVGQGITGVLPEYRGRGLARALKATLLEQMMEEHPEVKYVRTDNADSNAAMLGINTALGFRPYRSETYWQIPTERVLAYLGDIR